MKDDFSSRTGQLQDYITQIESKLKELDDELGGSKSGRTMSHHSKMDASKTQTGSIKSKSRSRMSGDSLKDIDDADMNELEMGHQDSQQIESVSKSKHSQSQVVQSSKKSSVASLKDGSPNEHTNALEEKAESSLKPSVQQSLKGIEGDASGTLNVNEKTSHHTQSIQQSMSNKNPPSPTGSVRRERKKSYSKHSKEDVGSRSRQDSPLKVSSPTHIKSSDMEED